MRVSKLSPLLLLGVVLCVQAARGSPIDRDARWARYWGQMVETGRQQIDVAITPTPEVQDKIITLPASSGAFRRNGRFCRNIQPLVSCGCILITQGLVAPTEASNIGRVTAFFLLQCPDALASPFVPLIACAQFSTVRLFNARRVVNRMNDYARRCIDLPRGQRLVLGVSRLLN